MKKLSRSIKTKSTILEKTLLLFTDTFTSWNGQLDLELDGADWRHESPPADSRLQLSCDTIAGLDTRSVPRVADSLDNDHLMPLINDTLKRSNDDIQVINGSQEDCNFDNGTDLVSRLQSIIRPPTRGRKHHRWRWFWFEQAQAIRLIRLDVPLTAHAGQTIRFRCIYDTKGDRLQSLSWYKNGREFYRYQPSERRQPVLAFNTTGIQLDMSRSRNNTITLVNTTTETSGRYKCEATGASFQEATLETYLEVTPAISSGVIALASSSLMPLLYITVLAYLIVIK